MGQLCGIYAILHVASNRRYIGQSRNISSRLGEHKRQLRRGTHDNDYLQKTWNKYGELAFEFAVVEVLPLACTREQLKAREEFWMSRFQTLQANHGFNLIMAGVSHTPAVRRTLSEIQNARWANEQTRQNQATLMKQLWETPEWRNHVSQSVSKAMQTEAHHQVLSARSQKTWREHPTLRHDMQIRMQTDNPAKRKLTDQQVIELKARERNGESRTALAKEYEVTTCYISDLMLGKRRSYIP